MEYWEWFGAVFGANDGYASWRVLPQYPSAGAVIELLLDTPEFFVMFFNSCIQAGTTLFFQLLLGTPAAWAFARFRFPGRRVLFYLYIVLMIMPFQVTMVSDYLVLYQLEFLDTHWSVILCYLFSTFPVFIMERFFRSIPESLMEAAKLDGAGEWRIFFQIGLPLGFHGIAAVGVLNFIEYWNALEPPITFLKDKTLWPLSLYLSEISEEQAYLSMAASLIIMLPTLFLFLWGQQYLEQGIAVSGLKE